jgi:hypothetical protein
MKLVRVLPLLFVGWTLAWGEEAVDLTAIAETIASLNRPATQALLFTGDSDARTELQKLWSGKKATYAVRPGAGQPKVVISSEPWGEAQIVLPGPVVEATNPRFVGGAVRFLSPDVALADGSLVERTGEERQSTPLLFVMKREGSDWRIASMRVLAAR